MTKSDRHLTTQQSHKHHRTKNEYKHQILLHLPAAQSKKARPTHSMQNIQKPL